MRTCLILLCLLAAPASAQWVRFEACGQDVDEQEIFGPRHFTTPDTISHYWVWEPAIIAIQAYKGVVMSKVQCTSIMLSNRKILVKGNSAETMRKLKKAK